MKMLILSLIVISVNTLASGAHSHGNLKLDFAMDGTSGTLAIHGSADCFLGFEHKPKNEQENLTLKKLDDNSVSIGRYFTIAQEFNCTYKRKEFSFKDEESEDGKDKNSKHKNFSIQYDVNCIKKISKTTIEFDFSKIFAQVKEVEIQFISNDYQTGSEVDSNKGSINVK